MNLLQLCCCFYNHHDWILGKGESIWDVFSHAGKVDNNQTGDVADDSYHKFGEDVNLLRAMKVTLTSLYTAKPLWTDHNLDQIKCL